MAAPRPTAKMAAASEKLRRALRPYPPADRYLVGVSGGRDSVSLLHLLREAGYQRLIVCHLDHQLRPESVRDAEFVEDLARGWDYPVVSQKVDVAALAAAGKISLETAARNARRAFLVEVSRRRRCRTAFLAHHADDQVETFLFRLLRGAGPAGLSAMRPESAFTLGGAPLRVLRPLLGMWRSEIDAYVRAHSLPFREDASNAELAHARNRLRANVLPLIERELGRNIRPTLWRAAEVLGAEETWINGLLDAEPALPAKLPAKTLVGQPVAKQRRLLRRWLQAQRAPAVGFEEIDLVRSLLDIENGPAKVNLPGGWHARRREGALFCSPPAGG